MRGDCLEDHSLEDGSAVLVVFRASFDEAPTVDVAYVRLAFRSEQVESADVLPEDSHDLRRD